MNSNLILATTFLILLQSPIGSSLDEYYSTCGNKFTCGNRIHEIGYPFRGFSDPAYCSYPNLILECDQNNAMSYIMIANAKYLVLDIFPNNQTMRIVRLDILGGTTCPQQMANTTLDHSVFDYTTESKNATFLYGCPSNYPGMKVPYCGDGVYVMEGDQETGDCNGKVIVPVLSNANGYTGWVYLQQGFVIRWNIDSKACSDCVESNGRCGYNYGTNQTACYCQNPPYIAYNCSTATPVSPANTPSSGMFFLILGYVNF